MKSIAIAFFLLTSQQLVAQASDDYQLLWEITGKKLKNPSYLFGSMHSNDSRLFQFPDSLYTAFVKADAVVLETDVAALFDEYDVRLDLFDLEILNKNKPYTNSREATRTVYGNEDGRPQFLDAYFQQTGYCGGKAFFPLEALKDQLQASGKLDNLTAHGALSSIFFSRETFMQSYIQGDVATLSKMLKSQLDGIPGAYDALITKRNLIMANGLDTLMRKQAVFCAIGSGHLYGPEGVIQLLRSRGYTVRAVQANYSQEPTADKLTVNNWRTYNVTSDTFNFSIALSGKPAVFSSADTYRYIYQELGQGNTYELIVRKTAENLEECKSEFIDNQRQRPKEIVLANGLKALEGMVVDEWKGLQWKRIIINHDLTYILICYGGNKFMHSNRPENYFNKLIIKLKM